MAAKMAESWDPCLVAQLVVLMVGKMVFWMDVGMVATKEFHLDVS